MSPTRPGPDRPREIRSVLGRLRGAFRRLLVLHGSGRLLLLLTGAITGLFALDYFLVLPPGVRVILTLGALAAVATSGWRWLLWPATAPLPDIELAHRLEASHPELRDKLLAAVAFTADGAGPAADGRDDGAGIDPRESLTLVQATIADATAAVAAVRPSRAAPGRRALRFAGAGAAATVALALAAMAQPALAKIWLERAVGGSTRWPQRTRLTLLNPTARVTPVARGTGFTIEVQAAGTIPARADLHLDYGNGSASQVRLALQDDDRYIHEFVSVPESFEFWVVAGDGRTERYAVKALIPPELDVLSAWLTHPKHTRLPDTPIDAPLPDGNVRAPVGTRVRLQGSVNKAVKEGALVISGDRTLPLTLSADGRTVSREFELAEDGSYVVRLADLAGLTGLTPFRYRLRAIPDRPPVLRPVFPASDRNATPTASLPLACEIRDDYGIATVRVLYGLVGTGENAPPAEVRTAEIQMEADGFGPDKATVQLALDLSAVTVREAPGEPARPLAVGDRLRLWFEAEDHRPSPAPNVTNSREFTITIESAETIERYLSEQLARLRQTVELTRVEQAQALRKAEAVADAAKPSAAMESEAVSAQRAVVRRAGRMADQFARVAEEASINKLGDPNYRAGLRELRDLAGRVATEQTPRAARALETARRTEGVARRQALGEAREAQAAADGLLSQLLSRLERWEELADVLWGLRRVEDKQKQLKERVLEHLKAKLKDD